MGKISKELTKERKKARRGKKFFSDYGIREEVDETLHQHEDISASTR